MNEKIPYHIHKYRTPKHKEKSGSTSTFLEEKMTSKVTVFALFASFATPEKLWRGKTDRLMCPCLVDY
jgi:hypothetical protein